jgi:hypothetical protein
LYAVYYAECTHHDVGQITELRTACNSEDVMREKTVDAAIDQVFTVTMRLRVQVPAIPASQTVPPTSGQDSEWLWTQDILERERRLLAVLANNPSALGRFIKSWLLESLAECSAQDSREKLSLLHPDGAAELVRLVMDQLAPEDAAAFNKEIDKGNLGTYAAEIWDNAIVIVEETTISKAS